MKKKRSDKELLDFLEAQMRLGEELEYDRCYGDGFCLGEGRFRKTLRKLLNERMDLDEKAQDKGGGRGE